MSTTAAGDPAAAAPKAGKKKLIMILAIVGVLVAGAGGAAVFMMKKNAAAAAAAAEAEDEEGGGSRAKTGAKHGNKVAPVFVPLDPFTVNLADKQAERFAQVGITLEIEDVQVAEQIKVYMPVIRNNVLLALSERTAAELMDRDGKARLAERVRRESSRALGVDTEEHEAAAAAEGNAEAAADTDEGQPGKKKKKKREPPPLPITAVHFSNFIIQ